MTTVTAAMPEGQLYPDSLEEERRERQPSDPCADESLWVKSNPPPLMVRWALQVTPIRDRSFHPIGLLHGGKNVPDIYTQKICCVTCSVKTDGLWAALLLAYLNLENRTQL